MSERKRKLEGDLEFRKFEAFRAIWGAIDTENSSALEIPPSPVGITTAPPRNQLAGFEVNGD